MAHKAVFPRTHNLSILLSLLPEELEAPAEIMDSRELSVYAVASRYPGEFEAVTEPECEEAVRQAELVVAWTETKLGLSPEAH